MNKSTVPEGYIYFGKGPLKVLNSLTTEINCVAACFGFGDKKWEIGDYTGSSAFNEYAIKAGTELARLNGLEPEKRPLPTVPPSLPKLPDHLVYVGEGPFDWMRESRVGAFDLFGVSMSSREWTNKLGYYGDCIPRALPKDSPLLKKYFILPETSTNDLTSAPETSIMTPMNKKTELELTFVSNDKIQTPNGYIAFQITKQENVKRYDSFMASNGIVIESRAHPKYSGGGIFYIRGHLLEMNDRILVTTKEAFDRIKVAVAEFLKARNTPVILKTVTFFYKNEKNGQKKRRLVDVYVDDRDAIEGNDKDVTEGTPYRRFLKKNIIGDVVTLK